MINKLCLWNTMTTQYEKLLKYFKPKGHGKKQKVNWTRYCVNWLLLISMHEVL